MDEGDLDEHIRTHAVDGHTDRGDRVSCSDIRNDIRGVPSDRAVRNTLAAYGVLYTRGSRPAAGDCSPGAHTLADVAHAAPSRIERMPKRRFLDRDANEGEGRVTPSRKIRAARVKNRESTVWSEAIRVITHTNLRRTGCSYSSWSAVFPEEGAETCVYCLGRADTLDHLVGVVQNGRPSGFGDTQFNLVPCCSLCNTSKGQRDFRGWMMSRFGNSEYATLRIAKLEAFQSLNKSGDTFDPSDHSEMFRGLRKRLSCFFEKYDDLVRKCASCPGDWQNLISDYDKDTIETHLLHRMLDGTTLDESCASL